MGVLTTTDNKSINEGDVLYALLESIKVSPDGSYYFGTIGVLHQAVHEKLMHTLSYTKENVADGSSLLVRFKATTKDMHLRLAWTSEGKSRLRSYKETTYTADGTPITPFNRQTAEVSNLVGEFYIDPTVNVLGPRRGNDFIGAGGATALRVGGTGSGDIETIVNAGTELLIEILNARGSASDLNIIANVYEREPFGG